MKIKVPINSSSENGLMNEKYFATSQFFFYNELSNAILPLLKCSQLFKQNLQAMMLVKHIKKVPYIVFGKKNNPKIFLSKLVVELAKKCSTCDVNYKKTERLPAH